MIYSEHIYNEDNSIDKEPDFDKGYLHEEKYPCVISYVIDAQEEGHWETIAEYPETGGKDVEWVVDTPQEGHWQACNSDGEVLDFEVDLSEAEGIDKNAVIDDIAIKRVFIPYTQDELEAMRIEREKAEKQAQFQEELPGRVDLFEEIQAEQDAAICDLYEQTLTIQAETDTAICELYEMLIGD